MKLSLFYSWEFSIPSWPNSSPLSHNAVLAFWCFYNRNKKNTVEIRWLKSVVQIYNAVNSEQPAAAKADLYPLPVVLLASPAREPYFWLYLTVPIHYERLHNHNKAKHNKTVCIFLGIYCIFKALICVIWVDCSLLNKKQITKFSVKNTLRDYSDTCFIFHDLMHDTSIFQTAININDTH